MQNAINWFEIPTKDFDRAVKFYNSIFNVQMHITEMGPAKMAFLPCEKGAVGGAVVNEPGREPALQGTLVYLNAGEMLDPILARVDKAGGKVVHPKTQVTPEIGFIATFTDTEGNQVALHSPK